MVISRKIKAIISSNEFICGISIIYIKLNKMIAVKKLNYNKTFTNLNATFFENLLNASNFNSSNNETGSRGGGVFERGNDGEGHPFDQIETDDAAWILTATFIIFTMQSGFGLLESGCVSVKNESNIMIKNVVDVVFGGFTYWLFGYGLSFGRSSWTNPFCGWGSFAINPDEEQMGQVYTTFFFQLSFATTSTTIVSGAVAERFRFSAYVIFSALNTVIYCIPAGWIWGSHGFLYKMGVIDVAGSCAVHLCGGVSSLVAAIMVGPRLGRYDKGTTPLPLGSPTSALLGLFMLWWGWLGFNCGSTFGIRGHKWKYAARTAVTTLLSSIGGGLSGMTISYVKNKRQMQVSEIVNSILGSLVSVTGGCALYTTFEALCVGLVGGSLSLLMMPLMNKMHIDDPVGAVSVHAVGGLWGMMAIGLFVKEDCLLGLTKNRSGVFRGGGFSLLGIQLLACVTTMLWSMTLTYLLLKMIDRFFVSIRMSEWEEFVGADFAEHGLKRKGIGISHPESATGNNAEDKDFNDNRCRQRVLKRVQHLSSLRRPRLSAPSVKISRNVLELNPSVFLNRESPEQGVRVNATTTSCGVSTALRILNAKLLLRKSFSKNKTNAIRPIS